MGLNSFNLSKIEDLIDMDPSKDFLKQLIGVFENEMNKSLPLIRSCYESKNFLEMSRLAHRLRSTSLNLGASELGEAFQKIEYMNKDNISDNQIKDLVNDVEIKAQEACRFLYQYTT